MGEIDTEKDKVSPADSEEPVEVVDASEKPEENKGGCCGGCT